MSGAFGGIRDADVAGAGLCTGECSSAAAPCRCDGRVVPGAGRAGGTVSGSVVVRPPRDLLAKPGEGRWVTRGGVVLTVNGDRDEVERQLAGGELACSSCGEVLGGWGNAQLRRVRAAAEGPDAEMVPTQRWLEASMPGHGSQQVQGRPDPAQDLRAGGHPRRRAPASRAVGRDLPRCQRRNWRGDSRIVNGEPDEPAAPAAGGPVGGGYLLHEVCKLHL